MNEEVPNATDRELVFEKVPVGKLPVGRKRSRTEVEYLAMVVVSWAVENILCRCIQGLMSNSHNMRCELLKMAFLNGITNSYTGFSQSSVDT